MTKRIATPKADVNAAAATLKSLGASMASMERQVERLAERDPAFGAAVRAKVRGAIEEPVAELHHLLALAKIAAGGIDPEVALGHLGYLAREVVGVVNGLVEDLAGDLRRAGV